MPELPEVENYRRYLEQTSLHQPIKDIYVEDTKLLTTDYDTLYEKLKGKQFVGTKRVGKNLFVELDAPYWLHLHFGMTGDLNYFRFDEEAPRFARIIFSFTNGYKLGFICPRKFERVGLVENVSTYLQKKKINQDALEISVASLSATFRKKKAPIKAVLLDQSTVAGIGNWIVDELLFHAKIHPEKLANQLTEQETTAIHEAMQMVLKTAIELEAYYDHFPKNFLIHARHWEDKAIIKPEKELCPTCQTEIQIKKVGGRTTYFCPNCQLEENISA